jgi:hypothetical protein
MRLLVYAQDPGGANVLAPIVRRLQAAHASDMIVAWHPLAEPAFRRAGVAGDGVATHVAGLPADDSAVDGWLSNAAPSHVLCTASSRHLDLTNARLIAVARRRGIPTLSFFDHWVGFDRFQDDSGAPVYLPDVVGVPDRHCQERVTALGRPEASVPIVGHAHLEAIARRPRSSRAGGPLRLLLVSQPSVADRSFTGALFLRDGGHRAIDRIAAVLADRVASGLLEIGYRPHPKERGGDPLPPGITRDAGEGGDALLDRYDIFAGITSMVLFEAAVARRFVVQLDLPALRASVSGDWPPYQAGTRVTAFEQLPAAVDAIIEDVREARHPAGVPGLQLEGSLERSVALCEAFLK